RRFALVIAPARTRKHENPAMADDVMTPDPQPATPSVPVELPTPEAPAPEAHPARSEAAETPPGEPAPAPSNKHWYVVKVQSGREESIKEAIERRVKIEGLEEFFGQIIIPVERVTMMRNGKRVQREQKLYPGYLMVEVE